MIISSKYNVHYAPLNLTYISCMELLHNIQSTEFRLCIAIIIVYFCWQKEEKGNVEKVCI